MSSLRTRILTGLAISALLVLLLLYAHPLLAGPALGLIVLIGAWEWSALVRLRSLLGRAAYVLLLAVAALLGQRYFASPATFMQLMQLTLLWWLLALVWVAFAPTRVSMLSAALAGVLTLVPAWLAMVRIVSSWPRGGEWALFILMVAIAADTGAFFAGHRFGRVRLAPRVSPGKTWEGVLGGMLAAAVLGCIGALWFAQPLRIFLPLCLGAAALSVVGDLTESLLKRRAGLKDSGRLLPGHGGVLDRIDSVTAAAPAMAAGLIWMGVGQ
ncbi:MAG: phosphatidate cytidylyltransferase [Gammaproteobacteria bacterium]|nr:phosphatidate cytidylyltransferase [Gammaproteobacteria bacterium]